jgi:hypothetical protein
MSGRRGEKARFYNEKDYANFREQHKMKHGGNIMDTIQISFLIAIVGCFVGLAGWISGRDKKIAGDAEWKGAVNTKLDLIIGINQTVVDHEKRLTECEQSAKSVYYRLERMEGKEK